jgi:hypothetical protein
MAAAGCSTTSAVPDHGAADASADASPALGHGDVDAGFDAGQSVPTCMRSADCASGQICCATEAMTAECQAGPCPYLQAANRSIQLCGAAADCFVAGDTCDDTRLPVKICDPPIDDGGPSDAGQTDVASDGGLDARGGDVAVDTGATEAAEGGAADAAADGDPLDAGGG